MNSYHQEILEEIKRISPKAAAGEKCNHGFDLNRYMGTKKPMYDLSNGQIRQIIRQWLKNHPSLTCKEFVMLLDSLYQGVSHTERCLGGKILEYSPKLRKQLNPELIKKWLTGAEGWGEVDSLCQSSFSAEEVLANWPVWERLLGELSKDPNVHKRRASLVLLCKAARESNDPRLVTVAFGNIERLKGEKDILITKAISWLLRDLIRNHRDQVERYLQENKETLPKIALREVTHKLLTGKK